MLDLDLAAMAFSEFVEASNLCLSLTKCCTADNRSPRSAALVWVFHDPSPHPHATPPHPSHTPPPPAPLQRSSG